MPKPFIPKNFCIPDNLITENFLIRKLTINDLIKDYEAVMSSVDHLMGTFGPGDDWPKDLTLEENLVDLGWHQKEFELRKSFTYTIMSLAESKCLGAIYINPSEKEAYDAEAVMWVRQSELKKNLDRIIFSKLKEWLCTRWNFSNVAYPGREIPWNEWQI